MHELKTSEIQGHAYARLADTLECEAPIDPMPIARLLQRIIDQFSQIPELDRTDFLGCLLAFSQRFPQADDILDLSTLEPWMERLESWELELVLDILGQFPRISVLKAIYRYCEHPDSHIREVARRAMDRALPDQSELLKAV